MSLKILITGWSGFIGRAVTKLMDDRGVQWIPFKGNVLLPEDFKNYRQCDAVLHLAGINRTEPTIEKQKSLIKVNLIGTINAADFALAQGCPIIFASTCCYGNKKEMPIPETEPITYHDAYSFSKFSAEEYLQACHKFLGLKGTILRIFNAYGPDQPIGYLIVDIINKMLNGKLTLYNLSSTRDYIFVNDIAELIVKVIKNPVEGLHTVNVGSGTGHSVREILDIMFKLMGRTVAVENENRPDFIEKSVADVKQAKKIYDWHSKKDIQDGLLLVLRKYNLLAIPNPILSEKVALNERELKVIIGAAAIGYPQWIDTEEKDLDVVSVENWKLYFKPNSIKCLLAEHVWEHIDPVDQELATLNCFHFLKPGGVLRIAVPDDFRRDRLYLEEVLPPKDGHTMMFNYQTLSKLLKKCGFIVTLLEYFDENENFHHTPWDLENGMIRRSLHNDDQVIFQRTAGSYQINYSSLIIDAVKPV